VTIIRAINDCQAVLVVRIGDAPREGLERAGIEAVDRFALEYIEQSVIAYFRDYLGRLRRGEIKHASRGDADIRQGALVA
jgi:nitrogen fixation protein NifB